MKKSIIVLMIVTVLLVFPLLAFGKSKKGFDSYLNKGDLAVTAGVGLLHAGLALYPGVEYFVYQTELTDFLPLTFGVSGRGFLNFYSTSDVWGTYGYTAFGLGGFGTVHYSFKAAKLDLPDFFNRLDFYWGLGFVYTNYRLTGDWANETQPSSSLTIASYGGFNYFINDKLAVFLEGNYWSYGGGSIGVLYKL